MKFHEDQIIGGHNAIEQSRMCGQELTVFEVLQQNFDLTFADARMLYIAIREWQREVFGTSAG